MDQYCSHDHPLNRMTLGVLQMVASPLSVILPYEPFGVPVICTKIYRYKKCDYISRTGINIHRPFIIAVVLSRHEPSTLQLSSENSTDRKIAAFLLKAKVIKVSLLEPVNVSENSEILMHYTCNNHELLNVSRWGGAFSLFCFYSLRGMFLQNHFSKR